MRERTLTTQAPVEEYVAKRQAVVVTGAGGGIGRACALRYATEGATVAIIESNPDTAASVAS